MAAASVSAAAITQLMGHVFVRTLSVCGFWSSCCTVCVWSDHWQWLASVPHAPQQAALARWYLTRLVLRTIISGCVAEDKHSDTFAGPAARPALSLLQWD